MSTDPDDENSGENVDSKVARLLAVYGLGEEYGDRLEELWTADGDRRESLRTLADRFNKRLLESAMTDAGMTTVDGEVANLYRLLTSDEVSSGDRTEARRRLEQNGIDVDELLDDFVTYQAIRTYLKEVQKATYDHTTETTRDGVQQRIDRVVGRTASVAEGQLEQLRQKGELTLDSFRLLVDVQVYCEGCNTQYEISELLERGGCDCEE